MKRLYLINKFNHLFYKNLSIKGGRSQSSMYKTLKKERKEAEVSGTNGFYFYSKLPVKKHHYPLSFHSVGWWIQIRQLIINQVGACKLPLWHRRPSPICFSCSFRTCCSFIDCFNNENSTVHEMTLTFSDGDVSSRRLLLDNGIVVADRLHVDPCRDPSG